MTSSKPSLHRAVPPPTGGTPRPANAYARFIPREELQDFAAWQPGTFGGAAPGGMPPGRAAATAPVEPPPPPEPTPPPAPPIDLDALEAAWAAQVQEARQQGWQDGYRDGLEALEAAKRQFAQQTTAQLTQVVGAFQDQIEAMESRMADAVVQTAVLLARQVVRTEISQRPELMTQVARDAINAVMLSARHLRLRLHPDDMALVMDGASEALAAREVQVLPDSDLSPGGCQVESDLGVVDARIETRWAHAAAVFDVPLAWHEPEPPAGVEPSPDMPTPDEPSADGVAEEQPS